MHAATLNPGTLSVRADLVQDQDLKVDSLTGQLGWGRAVLREWAKDVNIIGKLILFKYM